MMFFIEDQFTFYFIFFNLSYIIENIKKCHPYNVLEKEMATHSSIFA